MSALTPGQQATIALARKALATSHETSLGTSSERDLCHNIGRLEIALEQALRVIDELAEGT